eukprot:SAG31_NODE_2920_length_4909_cov_14.892100_3_plen_68_part_00
MAAVLFTGVDREYFLFSDSLEDGSALKASEIEGLAHTEFFNSDTHSNKLRFRNDLPQVKRVGPIISQ